MEISVTFSGQSLDRTLSQFIQELAQDVYTDARENTPVRSGNARRGWVKSVTPTTASITNQVPYIGKLEAGASRQAPRGIIGPTLTQIKGKYK